MWDDSGASGFCCWVRWDWEKGVPLEMKRDEGKRGGAGRGEGEEGAAGSALGDASWWEALCRSLGPPLVPAERLEASRVGDWLDRHTMKVHGWGEEALIELEEGEGKEAPLPAAGAAADDER